MKGIYREYAAAKATFEGAMQDEFCDRLPAGHELKFGYNFGKLSVAVGPARERKPQAAKPTQGLGDWLTAQANSGRAA